MEDKLIMRRAYIHGVSVFIILILLNYILSSFNYSWAKKSYEIIIIILFSIVIAFFEITIKIGKSTIYKKNRIPFLMIGTISSITIISYVRDVFNKTILIIENGKLTDESCIFLIGVMFLFLFSGYVYREFK